MYRIVACAWILCALVSCGDAPKPAQTTIAEAPVARPNIVIVLFDTLRADHVSPYTASETHTPTIMALAGSGVTFMNAYSPSSYTRTSVATLLTSTNPWTHGCLTKTNSLPASLHYLPEVLHQNGYRTLGVVGNAHLAQDFGFSRGFDEYSIMPVNGKERNAARQAGPADLAQWVWTSYIADFLKRDDASPFFLYLHEVDPHGPYEPPAPYDTLFETVPESTMRSDAETLNAIIRGEIHPTDADLRHLNGQYRGEIAYMDKYLQEFQRMLDESGAGKNTIFVFLSDHGEEFYEHQRMHHWITLYNEVLRIPLIIRYPDNRNAGQRVTENAGLIDVAPTLLDAVGLQVPGGFGGHSLLSPQDPSRPVFGMVRSYLPTEPLRESVIVNGMKLIRSTADNGVTYELYDLLADPAERTNLRAPNEPRAQTLLKLLDDATAGAAAPTDAVQAIPKEIEENLRALGYVN